ncbi:MAG TPA: Ig-like domain-containing protein [Candidatus Sulfotelmatobacter sp.]|nr:Ig-like domain-containing protein [Candidatus Sulfotelmatobacter sp.]
MSSIQVSPASMSIGMGAQQQFTATAQLSDGSTKDMTSSVQWSSSDSNIASIAAGGTASGSAAGTVTITAQSGTLQATATLKVSSAASNLASIAISPAASSVAVNTSQQFTATGTYSDGSSADLTALVAWTSSSTATATIASDGAVAAVAPGTTNISASFAGVSQSTTLTVTAPTMVSIAVTPVGLTLGIGINQQFVATATYSDGSSADLVSGVTWTSSSTTVATVNSSGLAATLAAGSTTIAATVGSFTDTSTLTVVAAHLTSIFVTPAIPSIALGTTQLFTAVGNFDDGSTQWLQSVTWSSSSSSVATVDSTGLATSVGMGSTTITASSGSVSGTASLTVTGASLISIAITPVNSTMAVGTTKQFTATGTFSDSSTQDVSGSAVWTSSNPAAATINGQGLLTSVATGSSTIKAIFGGVRGSTGLTVSSAYLVSITVNPPNPRIARGTSIKFSASGTFSDGSTASNLSGVSWKSSKPSVASLRGSGLAHGKKGGTATISATASGVTGSTTLTVGTGALVSLAVTPMAPTAAAGSTQQFVATGTFSDGSTQDITLNSHWSSSAATVATMANAPSVAGVANCSAPGSTTIGANSGGVAGSAVLTVQ